MNKIRFSIAGISFAEKIELHSDNLYTLNRQEVKEVAKHYCKPIFERLLSALVVQQKQNGDFQFVRGIKEYYLLISTYGFGHSLNPSFSLESSSSYTVRSDLSISCKDQKDIYKDREIVVGAKADIFWCSPQTSMGNYAYSKLMATRMCVLAQCVGKVPEYISYRSHNSASVYKVNLSDLLVQGWEPLEKSRPLVFELPLSYSHRMGIQDDHRMNMYYCDSTGEFYMCLRNTNSEPIAFFELLAGVDSLNIADLLIEFQVLVIRHTDSYEPLFYDVSNMSMTQIIQMVYEMIYLREVEFLFSLLKKPFGYEKFWSDSSIIDPLELPYFKKHL